MKELTSATTGPVGASQPPASEESHVIAPSICTVRSSEWAVYGPGGDNVRTDAVPAAAGATAVPRAAARAAATTAADLRVRRFTRSHPHGSGRLARRP
ncbi:hypothetical protein DNK56_32015 [Streptomyces sp. AC1-42W]|nr:hypothetical protein DNK56_32015 [Streptomyces sp. AC1-42W]PZT80463.1 hypothetical protein DNK55_00675 [Streptomyces sp. AC1-42T]